MGGGQLSVGAGAGTGWLALSLGGVVPPGLYRISCHEPGYGDKGVEYAGVVMLIGDPANVFVHTVRVAVFEMGGEHDFEPAKIPCDRGADVGEVFQTREM